jgi:hypothetical protein
MVEKTKQLDEADAAANQGTIAAKAAPDSISDIVPDPEEVSAAVVAAARAVGSKAPKRLADKEGGEETVKESVGAAFGTILTESGLDESLITRATALFEAAVAEKTKTIETSLVEDFTAYKAEVERTLTEAAEAATKDLSEKLTAYADYIAEQFMTENKLAVENGLRVELAESLFNGLKKVFVEHNFTLPEGGVDVVKSLEEKVEDATAKLNESVNENIALKKEIETFKAKSVVDSLVEGLTATQAEKIRSLAEAVSYANLDELKTKVEVIRESVVTVAPAAKRPTDNFLAESMDTGTEKVIPDSMQQYVNTLTKFMSR